MAESKEEKALREAGEAEAKAVKEAEAKAKEAKKASDAIVKPVPLHVLNKLARKGALKRKKG